MAVASRRGARRLGGSRRAFSRREADREGESLAVSILDSGPPEHALSVFPC